MMKKFTLIELIVVVVVLGILTSITVPNISNYTKEAKSVGDSASVKTIEVAVDRFVSEKGYYPVEDDKTTLDADEIIKLEKLVPQYLHDKPTGQYTLSKNGEVNLSKESVQEEGAEVTPEPEPQDEWSVLPDHMLKYTDLGYSIRIDGMSDSFDDRTNVQFPSTINGKDVTEIQSYAFYQDWSDVKNIRLPEKLVIIRQYAFKDSKIKTVEFPDSLQVIQEAAFMGTLVEDIKFGSGLYKIDGYTFHAAKAKELILPDSLEVVSSTAFSGMDKLERVRIPNELKGKIEKTHFGSNVAFTY